MAAISASSTSRRILLTLFTSKNCSLCDEAKESIGRVGKKIKFDLEQKDIYAPENQEWFRKYKFDIPVLHLNHQFLFQHRIKEETLEGTLKKYLETGIIES
ncbi:hypothetical protein G9A89_016222 [Geosiphon pyriformis]|nr:hypothetical protein G9A89_016222 [Geosiphon pyriformis]